MYKRQVDKKEVKRLVSQGALMELPNSQKLVITCLSVEPANSDDRNPGRFERLLEEPVRTYVPLLLRLWVMDSVLTRNLFTRVRKLLLICYSDIIGG